MRPHEQTLQKKIKDLDFSGSALIGIVRSCLTGLLLNDELDGQIRILHHSQLGSRSCSDAAKKVENRPHC